jgi:hypothetical protein
VGVPAGHPAGTCHIPPGYQQDPVGHCHIPRDAATSRRDMTVSQRDVTISHGTWSYQVCFPMFFVWFGGELICFGQDLVLYYSILGNSMSPTLVPSISLVFCSIFHAHSSAAFRHTIFGRHPSQLGNCLLFPPKQSLLNISRTTGPIHFILPSIDS